MYGERLRGTSELGFHIRLSKKVSKKHDFPKAHLYHKYPSPDPHPALPSFAWPCPVPRQPGAGIQGIPLSQAHVPIRHQSARPPAGVSDSFYIPCSNLRLSQRIFNSPGRHHKRIFRVSQFFRTKTAVFIKKAICTSSAATRRSPWIPTFWGPLQLSLIHI